MSLFNTNLNAFSSSIEQIKDSIHAFTSSGVAKRTRNQRQQKRSLINSVTNTIETVDTSDFGIRVIIIKTTD